MSVARARELSDRALLLRRFPYGESSLVVHLLTPRHGRVAALAKGAYRPSSRAFAALDLFDTLRVSWRERRGTELALVVAADVVTLRRAPTRDLGRYRAALSSVEVTGIGARSAHPEPRAFELLEGVLDALSRDDVEPDLARLAHELALLETLGLAPALARCASCGGDPGRGRPAFCAELGGRQCEPCSAEARAGGRTVRSVDAADLRVAEGLARTPLEQLPRVRADARRIAGVAGLLDEFLEAHLETRPRARPRLSESRA